MYITVDCFCCPFLYCLSPSSCYFGRSSLVALLQVLKAALQAHFFKKSPFHGFKFSNGHHKKNLEAKREEKHNMQGRTLCLMSHAPFTMLNASRKPLQICPDHTVF